MRTSELLIQNFRLGLLALRIVLAGHPGYNEFATSACRFHVNRNFRFGFQTRASYASPALGHNELATRASPSEINGVPTARFCPSDESRFPPRNRFSDTAPILTRSAADFATAIVVLTRWHRQCPDPPQHLAEQPPVQMPLGQQQPVVPGVLDLAAPPFSFVLQLPGMEAGISDHVWEAKEMVALQD